MTPAGDTTRPGVLGRATMVGVAVALLAGLILTQQPPSSGSVRADSPALLAGDAAGGQRTDARTPQGRLRVRVEGELLGQRATITLRGVRGQARGKKVRLKLTDARTTRLPAGRYAISAQKIRSGGFVSLAARDTRKIRVNAGRSRTVVFRYFLQDSGSSDDSGQDVYSTAVDVGAPQGFVAASPDGSRIYAATEVPNISVINTADPTQVARIPTNSPPGGVAVSPDGSRLYFTETLVGKAHLVSVDTATSQRVGTAVHLADGCPVSGACTGQIAMAPDGSRLYVPLRTGRIVQVVDPGTGSVERSVSVESNPQTVAVSPDGSRLFTANAGAGTLSVVDSASGRSIHSVRIGTGTFGVAVSRDGHYAYVSSNGFLTAVDTVSGTIAFKVRTGGLGRSVALSPDGARAYVAVENADTVAVVDLPRRRSGDPVLGIPGPYAVAFAPDGLYAYVSQRRGNSVAVIEVATRVPEVEAVSVAGNPAPGHTLSAVVGAVVSVPAPARLSYRWQSSSSRNGPFRAISGATSPTYTPNAADAGQYLRVAVTAANALSSGPVQTSATVRVAERPQPQPGPTTTPTTAPPSPTGNPTPPGPTTAPPTPTPTISPTPPPVPASVAVRSRAGRSKLFVKVSPALDRRHHWSFSVQKKTTKKKRSWQTLGKKYRTTGARQTRTINLPRGTFRVVVAPAYGYASATSRSVRLAR